MQSAPTPPAEAMMENPLDFEILAQERSQGYWLLSQLFLKVPDAGNLRQLQTELASVDVSGPLGELWCEVESALYDPEPAAVEFTRRLVAIGEASGEALPYESFVREGTVPGTATKRVMECMADAGFADISPDAPSPDHIGAELRFMALLCYEEGLAWSNGNTNAAMDVLARQRRFLLEHLAAWVPEYCEELEARAEHDYMKAVARLTRRGLLADVAAVEELYMELDGDD